jgi:hypothetical protein
MALCVTLNTRQFFRIAAVVMALILLWRNNQYNDPYITLVALITLAVDGYLFLVISKECP